MSNRQASELWNRSADAWIAMVDEGDNSRTVLLDPAMLRLAGDVAGLKVCDVGCGEGRFCRMLGARGAQVTGVDPTESLIARAKTLDAAGEYLIGSGEDIPFVSSSFDIVVSYLVLIDIEDYRKAISEMVRILKAGGRLLVANMNSFVTTSGDAWHRDTAGRALHVAVDNYFREHGEIVAWRGIEIVNYHRPMEAMMKAFLTSGLRLLDFEEPRPTGEEAADNPRVADGLRVPFFHVMQWQKE